LRLSKSSGNLSICGGIKREYFIFLKEAKGRNGVATLSPLPVRKLYKAEARAEAGRGAGRGCEEPGLGVL
jgi:hypothetical protein